MLWLLCTRPDFSREWRSESQLLNFLNLQLVTVNRLMMQNPKFRIFLQFDFKILLPPALSILPYKYDMGHCDWSTCFSPMWSGLPPKTALKWDFFLWYGCQEKRNAPSLNESCSSNSKNLPFSPSVFKHHYFLFILKGLGHEFICLFI